MYLQQTLSKDEEIKIIVLKHWLSYAKSWVIFSAGLVVLLVSFSFGEPFLYILSLAAFVWSGIEYWLVRSIEMIVTNKRVVKKTGIFSVKTTELKNSKIESVELVQDFCGRLWGYGDIFFAGTGVSKLVFRHIANPIEIKKQLDDIVGN